MLPSSTVTGSAQRRRPTAIARCCGYVVVGFLLHAMTVSAAETTGVQVPAAPVFAPGEATASATTTAITSPLPNTTPPVADAATSHKQTLVKMAPLDTGTALLKTFGGLGVILLLILGCAKAVKWLGKPMGGQQPLLQLVAVLPLGTKEKLALVEVGGKQILIGITATQINPLMELAEPVNYQSAAHQTTGHQTTGHHTSLGEKIALSAQDFFTTGRAALEQKLVLGRQGKKQSGESDKTLRSEKPLNEEEETLSKKNQPPANPTTPLSAKTASEFSKKLNEFLKTGNRNP